MAAPLPQRAVVWQRMVSLAQTPIRLLLNTKNRTAAETILTASKLLYPFFVKKAAAAMARIIRATPKAA